MAALNADIEVIIRQLGDPGPVQIGRTSPEVASAWQYIIQNATRIQSVAEVAEYLDLNYHTLRNRFRRETGRTLKEHLICVRLLEAVLLLSGSDDLVKEIAWKVGFNLEGQLCRAMKDRLGVTPQVLRGRTRMIRLVDSALQTMVRLSSGA